MGSSGMSQHVDCKCLLCMLCERLHYMIVLFLGMALSMAASDMLGYLENLEQQRSRCYRDGTRS
eukprot:3415746-Amphidinium_carterae.2